MQAARKIVFRARSVVDQTIIDRNKEENRRLGLPFVGTLGPVSPNLAVVGGGPSVLDHVEELKAWDGDIWAVNGAMTWCHGVGIDAALFTIDPKESLFPIAEQARRAILGTSCAPSVVSAVSGPVEMFPLGDYPNGSSSASSAPMAAAARGHAHVTLFGCESSFTDRVHAYSWSDTHSSRVLVECGGSEYLTNPQLIMQAEYLAEIAREIPSFIAVRGRGFLPALIEHGDYSVSKVSTDIMESVRGN